MTSRAPQWFETKYIDGATHVIQDGGWRLKGAVNETGEIKGNQVVWKLAGAGQATEMSTAIEEVSVMNADRSTVTATMKDYEANEYIKITDIEKMSESEQQVAQQTAGYAMGRLFDQLIVGTMDAAGGAIATIDVSANAAPSTVDTIGANAQILAQGYNAEPEMYVALPQMVLAQLGMYREFSNSDYMGEAQFMKKLGAKTYQGVHYIPLPDSAFNYPTPVTPGADGVVDIYMWQKTAFGFVPNYALKSRIDYVPTKKAYLAANTMGCGQSILLPPGIRRIRTKQTRQLVRPSP